MTLLASLARLFQPINYVEPGIPVRTPEDVARSISQHRPTLAVDPRPGIEALLRALDFGSWPLCVIRRQGARIALLDHLGVAQKRRLAQPLDGDLDNPNGGNW